MFVRNGEAVGSVQVEPTVKPDEVKPEPKSPEPAKKPAPKPEPKAPEPAKVDPNQFFNTSTTPKEGPK